MNDLRPDECSHCFNLRRDLRTRLETDQVPELAIKERLAEVLCRGHTADLEERARKERRRQTEARRRAKRRWS